MSRRGFAPVVIVIVAAVVIAAGLVTLYYFQKPTPIPAAVPVQPIAVPVVADQAASSTASTSVAFTSSSSSTPKVTLIFTNPIGGEVIPEGLQNVDIRFRITGLENLSKPTWRFELWNNGFKFGDRGSLAVYSSSSLWDFSWEAGTYYAQGTMQKAPPGYGYYLKGYLLDDNKVVATAETKKFTLSAGASQPSASDVKMLYPQGNEVFQAGSTITVHWTTTQPHDTNQYGLELLDVDSASNSYALRICGPDPLDPSTLNPTLDHSVTVALGTDLDGKVIKPNRYKLHLFNCRGSSGTSNFFEIR